MNLENFTVKSKKPDTRTEPFQFSEMSGVGKSTERESSLAADMHSCVHLGLWTAADRVPANGYRVYRGNDKMWQEVVATDVQLCATEVAEVYTSKCCFIACEF